MPIFKAKSIIVSRKPNNREKSSWVVLIALFNENNPHLKGRVPTRVLEYKDIEKVRLKELKNISFYLAGNDLVVNDLVKINIEWDKEEKLIVLTGEQKFS